MLFLLLSQVALTQKDEVGQEVPPLKRIAFGTVPLSCGNFLLPCGFSTTGAFAFHSGLEFCRNLVERCKHIFIFDLFWNLSIVTD
jgi:hypothetical protein